MITLLAAPVVLAVLAQGQAPVVSWRKTESIRKGYYSMSAVIPHFRGNSVAELATQHLSQTVLTQMHNQREEQAFDAQPPHEHTWEWRATVSIRHANLISLVSSTYWFTGGAHPNSVLTGHNYAMVGGKAQKIGFADLVQPGQDAVAIASDLVVPRLKARGASSVVDGTVTKLTKDQADNFVVTPGGITWLLSKYEVASYAEGEFEVKVPWSEIRGWLRPGSPVATWSK